MNYKWERGTRGGAMFKQLFNFLKIITLYIYKGRTKWYFNFNKAVKNEHTYFKHTDDRLFSLFPN